MKAIQVDQFGGPEVLKVVDIPPPALSEGEAMLEVTAAGINYADTHETEDAYLESVALPYVPGREVVGRLSDGRRVLSLTKGGGYAEFAAVPMAMAFELPDEVQDGPALSLAVQGLTAHILLHTCARIRAGEAVVVHAGAGGVGTLAIQLARNAGAGKVIASASTPSKRELAMSLGADAAVDPEAADLTGDLIEANNGKPVDIVLEMIGGAAFSASLNALAQFGRLVTYGMASRVPPKRIDPTSLMVGSRAVIGCFLTDYLARPSIISTAFADLVDMTRSGALTPIVGEVYPLAEARRAHEDLRSRSTHGKLVLDPAL